MQWVSSDWGIPDNGQADTLAAWAHSQILLTIIVRVIEAHAIVRDSVLSHHPDNDVTGRSTSPPVLRKRITRATAPLLHYLRVDSACTKKTLHWFGKSETALCEARVVF